MSGNDLRKFLTIVETISSETTENILSECMDDSMKDWYMNATNEMVRRIKLGEYPVDVVNSLAREYSYMHGGDYAVFSFARDALDRRAWEMGLRYTDEDNTMYTKTDQHDGDIVPNVTEDDDEELMEEMLIEFGVVDRFLSKIFPGTAAKVMSNKEFKKLTKDMRTSFLRRFGFGKGDKATYENAVRFVKSLDVDDQFVADSIADFKKAGGSQGLVPNTPMSREDQVKFFATFAGNIMQEGGVDAVRPGVYKSTAASKSEISQKDDKSGDKAEQPISPEDIGLSPNEKFRTIKTANDAIKLVKKAQSGAELSKDELHDVALGLFKIATDAQAKRK